MHLGKALSVRCKAIRRALKQYNAAAQALDPPKKTLNWDTVSKYNFIEEFDMLSDTKGTITQKPWAQPAGRAALKTWNRIKRAREEIERCNIEARRVHTAIHDEEKLFSAVLHGMKDDILYEAVREVCDRRRVSNSHIMVWLQRLYHLPQFSGVSTPGTRTGGFMDHLKDLMDGDVLLSQLDSHGEAAEVELEAGSGAELDEHDDERDDDFGGLIDFIADLNV